MTVEEKHILGSVSRRLVLKYNYHCHFLPVRLLGELQSKGKVFPMLTESILTTHVSRWVSKARIHKNITFHCFRHTFAMQLLDKGVDIYTITALLGHRQVSSTQNYAKITPKKVLEAIMKIE